ncbi:Uu.00g021540.m01.CDS01 [Anthostomella pinea]|uniref:Uu.00g021540.m01.CDS01 n=1 Tax=Anthostomella pinea TaxID=933095 RepID=A0AAI8W081_9PEZI|nr:Uu.00g021540.m01.CDS01 [Anthostomella pinea]
MRSLAIFVIAFLQLVLADPAPPGLAYLYTVNVTLGDAIDVGLGPKGTRIVIPITGGTFSGPKLSGNVLNVGADWGLADRNGTFSPDSRYQLQTDDGANIFIQTNGPLQPDNTTHLRVTFETGNADYYWVNNVLAVGILRSGTGYVVIDTWQLTTTA